MDNYKLKNLNLLYIMPILYLISLFSIFFVQDENETIQIVHKVITYLVYFINLIFPFLKKVTDGILVEDYIFSSPSAASSVVCGTSSNGKTDWKDEFGKTINDYEKNIE